MKLLYLYIVKHNCIENQEFNFDSNYRFHLDRSNPQNWQLIEEYAENPLPDNFWTLSKGSKGVVESVSAIVGNNGSGKTSLANFLGDYIGFHGIDKKYLIIFKRITDQYPQYWTNLDVKRLKINCKINLVNEKEYPSDKYLPLIYFSPFYTTEHIINSNRSIDISTSSLLTQTNSSVKFNQGLAYYITEEYKRTLFFLSRYREKIKNQQITMTLPDPRGIHISLKDMDLLEFATNLRIDNKEWNELIKKIGELKKELKNTDFEEKIDVSVFDNNILDQKQLYNFLSGVFMYDQSDYFLHAYLCYIIAYWKQHIKQDGMTVQTIRNSSELHAQISKTGPEIIIEYIFNLIKFWFDNSYEKTYKKIIEIIKPYDKAAFTFFESLIDFLSCKSIKKNESEIEFNFSELEEIKDKFLVLVYNYNNIGLKDSFLLFNFDPKISAGEMSFLTIYSRIYDCIINNEKIKCNDEFILFLDEIETTLHPEWQRRLVSWMIYFLETFAKGKKIHIIFASHSPILLSDIPDSNVVFLKKDSITGKSTTVDHAEIGKTFGSNIYTLYKKSFFLNNGLLGEFAEQKIDNIIKDLLALELKIYSGNRENRYLELDQEIELIGEPVIRNQLKDRLKWVQMRNK